MTNRMSLLRLTLKKLIVNQSVALTVDQELTLLNGTTSPSPEAKMICSGNKTNLVFWWLIYSNDVLDQILPGIIFTYKKAM